MVWEVHQAVDVPLLGMGGISCATDAVGSCWRGSTAVTVNCNFVNPHATVKSVDGMARRIAKGTASKTSATTDGALE